MIETTCCVMFQCCFVELTGECVESTGIVVKNLSASWSNDKEKIAISDVSFQVDQVCTTLDQDIILGSTLFYIS
jgi:hypothetical protein